VDYLWLKALHIIAVMIWIGGMLVAAVTGTAALSARRQQGVADRPAFLESVRRWDRRVTTPAMLLVWALGLSLALNGGWFPQRWLLIKLAFVLLLTALHGMLSGNLRRLSRQEDSGTMAALRYAPGAIVVAVLVIVVLVVIKPF
jgi:putative membrane protein